MGKFSDFILNPGTAGPAIRQGIRQLGFAFISDFPVELDKYVRVDAAQTFTGGEKTQGRANIGAVIGTDVQAYDAGLQSIAALVTSANKLPYATGVDTYALTDLTAFARTLLDDADAATSRTTLGLVIGTNVQAYDAGLQSIAGLTTAADKMIYTTALDVYTTTDLSAFARTLLDDTSATAMKTTISLQNVDNTSDANKPVSTAQQTALNLKADLASPPLTGTPTAPTAAAGTNTTQIATTAHVQASMVAGNGQAWTDVSGSRAVSTSYQNTTGRPIVVNIAWGTASGVPFQVSTNNSTWVSVAASSANAGTCVSAIIPPGHYYRVNGAITIVNWAELR